MNNLKPDGNAWEVFVVKADAAVMGAAVITTGGCAPRVSDGTSNEKATRGCCG